MHHAQNFKISTHIIYTIMVLVTEIKYMALWPGNRYTKYGSSTLPKLFQIQSCPVSLPDLQQTICCSLSFPPLPPSPVDLLISLTLLILLCPSPSSPSSYKCSLRTHGLLWPQKWIRYLQILTYPSSLPSPNS